MLCLTSGHQVVTPSFACALAASVAQPRRSAVALRGSRFEVVLLDFLTCEALLILEVSYCEHLTLMHAAIFAKATGYLICAVEGWGDAAYVPGAEARGVGVLDARAEARAYLRGRGKGKGKGKGRNKGKNKGEAKAEANAEVAEDTEVRGGHPWIGERGLDRGVRCEGGEV